MARIFRHSLWPGSLLLAAFLLGGVLAPALHTVQHGLEYAEAQAGPHACDHSTHPATFEDPHAVVSLDLCPFCLHRIKASVEALPHPTAFAALDAVVSSNASRHASEAPPAYGARAPPPTA